MYIQKHASISNYLISSNCAIKASVTGSRRGAVRRSQLNINLYDGVLFSIFVITESRSYNHTSLVAYIIFVNRNDGIDKYFN